MKTFASLNHLTLIATLVAAPALYSSQALLHLSTASFEVQASSKNYSTLSSLSSSSTSSANSSSSSSITITNQAISQEIKRRAASLENTLATLPTELITLIADYDNAPLTADQLFELGKKYLTGSGVAKDEKLAVAFYQLAANQVHAPAQSGLANRYYKNEGVPANLTQEQRLTEAVRLYTLAANQGHAAAQNNLAFCYYSNKGVPANLMKEQRMTEAVRLFTLAANQNYAPAQNNLAVCYEQGAGATQNLGKALELYRRAAEQGRRRAQITICKAFQKGLLPKTEEFQTLADSCHKQLFEKLGSEQAVRMAIEKETIRLHDGILLDCQAEECTICRKDFEPLQPITILPCYHVFCPACIQSWFNANPRHLCPTCRQPAEESFSGTVMKKESTTKTAQPESKESKE